MQLLRDDKKFTFANVTISLYFIAQFLLVLIGDYLHIYFTIPETQKIISAEKGLTQIKYIFLYFNQMISKTEKQMQQLQYFIIPLRYCILLGHLYRKYNYIILKTCNRTKVLLHLQQSTYYCNLQRTSLLMALT